MILGIVFAVVLCLVWGVAGFVVGYRVAQRRTPVHFIQGRVPTMPLGNSVARMPGPGDDERRYESPSWTAESDR